MTWLFRLFLFHCRKPFQKRLSKIYFLLLLNFINFFMCHEILKNQRRIETTTYEQKATQNDLSISHMICSNVSI